MKDPTILIGADGIEYFIKGGKLVEKCLHKTTRNESDEKIEKLVCHDCGKVLILNEKKNDSEPFNPFQNFRNMHGREPRGIELSGLL